ncbi:ribonuclease H-like protein [Hesseltinella vesiculosa]|uniref:Ribonuclease H-like protein n=1 Tax=Hesseltinella vesiculosa TaxID=101127 RepID=A0A1X2G2L1_9FUNG|nr:ribonuclease H-like protein [Hesseltinella vesiculosa]
MTGLDITKDRLIEVACPEIVIHQSQELLDSMDEWCTEHHGKSGLTQAVLASNTTTKQAESMILEFLFKHFPADDWKGRIPLAGNSVHVDKQFLQAEMPGIVDYLHYRIIDVSTIKELAKRWFPAAANHMTKKKEKHRALDDIKESIMELQFYRSSVFLSEARFHQ